MDMTTSWILETLERHWAAEAVLLGATTAAWRMRRQALALVAERRRSRQVREEMEAYARLDVRASGEGEARGLAQRVCRVIAEASAFRRAAMLVRDEDGRLGVAGSLGMSEAMVAALNGWGERLTDKGVVVAAGAGGAGEFEVRVPAALGQMGVKVGTRSFGLELAEAGEGVLVAPLWTMGGRVVGVLAVGVGVGGPAEAKRGLEWMAPVEALAVKLARTMENAALAERLLKAEKLAGLGQLAGGVAHALNNPLTAVLGFAELIGETTGEGRVREDAAAIAKEALRMRETVQSLLNLWRPPVQTTEPVSMGGLVEELAEACREKLAARKVRLVVQTEEGTPAVVGNRAHLRQVLEHLLNNASQAIGAAQGVGSDDAGRDHAIRVGVSHDERGVHVIVSDTGRGFREAGRVFDPFYTEGEPGKSSLGLSICCGMVREHGGEISAFNLHPRGAAVVVELPV